MWVTTASLHFDDNAAKWLQMYKLKYGLGSWTSFVQAVEEQFGSDDYRSALDELLLLKQKGTVEEYASEFESLQFQICMHNSGHGELFFVAQFIKGLKEDIQPAVQMQLPDKVTKAILLAKMQQKMLDRGKYKAQRVSNQVKPYSPAGRADSKQQSSSSNLWRERQERDYRKANGLCFYCAEKYDAGHAERCSKRPKAHLNALVVNSLGVQLTDDILNQLAVEDAMNEEFCQLSLSAMSTLDHTDCIKLEP